MTLVTSMVPLLHLGFVIAGLPYSWVGQKNEKEIVGGSPYGASTVAGPMGQRTVSESDKEGARFHGKHIAELALKLASNTSPVL